MTKDRKILIAVLIIILCIYIYRWYNSPSRMVAKDGTKYKVYFSDSVNEFSKIANNIERLISRLMEIYPNDTRVLNLYHNFDRNNLVEKLPSIFDNDTSYVTRGEIHLCIRDKDNNLHDFNTVMFVAIHEVTHLATDSIGTYDDPHTDLFWETFKLFLQFAVEIGIYKPVDYKKHQYFYCDELLINHNPLFN